MTSNTFTPIIHATGAPYPDVPLPRGSMRLEEYVMPSSATLVLGIDMAKFKAHEKPPFLGRQLEVAIIGRPFHVRFAVGAGPIDFDAPYAPGLNGSVCHGDLLSALRGPMKSFVIVCVDRGIVRGIKPVLMDAKAWEVLAGAVAACPAIHNAAAYDNACANDEARWKPSDLLELARHAPNHVSEHFVRTTT